MSLIPALRRQRQANLFISGQQNYIVKLCLKHNKQWFREDTFIAFGNMHVASHINKSYCQADKKGFSQTEEDPCMSKQVMELYKQEAKKTVEAKGPVYLLQNCVFYKL